MDYLNITAFSQLVIADRPNAIAHVRGGSEHPLLSGTVLFYQAAGGCLVVAEIFNLPYTVKSEEGDSRPVGPFYGFHIHEGRECGSGSPPNAFSAAGGHLNPQNVPHPMHMGDMPSLLGSRGYAYMSFFTDKFTPEEVVGRTVIIHANADDYHTQPAGNAGARIGCGVITRVTRETEL